MYEGQRVLVCSFARVLVCSCSGMPGGSCRSGEDFAFDPPFWSKISEEAKEPLYLE